MTKLYFHDATSSVSGTLPSSTQSTLGAPSVSIDAQTVNRSMNTTIGTTQTSKSQFTASTLHKVYYTRFVSDPLQSNTTISANTWNISIAVNESNAAGNFPVSGTTTGNMTVYVWRPSTGASVGDINNSATGGTYTEPSAVSTEKSIFKTFSGSSVSALAGDVICIEFYWNLSNTASSTNIFYYDGATETNTNGTTVSDHASYIETPQALTFGSPVTGINQTIMIEWEES